MSPYLEKKHTEVGLHARLPDPSCYACVIASITASGLFLLSTLVASAVGREASLGPKTVLMDNLFHGLEPSQIIGVVIWEIKRLWLTC
jgi:preprotein translocase subunit SecY